MSSLNLSPLESAVIDRLLRGASSELDKLRGQVRAASITDRSYTDSGVIVSFDVPRHLRLPVENWLQIGDVEAAIEGVSQPARFVLYVSEGLIQSLEGYVSTGTWPRETSRFTLRYDKEPRDLSLAGGPGDAFEQAARNFDDFLHRAAERSRQPVDVAQIADDDELDDRLWARVSELAGEASRDEVLRMPDDVRAYFLTRLFEWLSDADGPDAFVTYYPGLLEMLPDAYRHMGLTQAAEAAARFSVAAPTQQLIADSDNDLSPAELEELRAMLNEVGSNDAARIAFVRSRADAIARWTTGK